MFTVSREISQHALPALGCLPRIIAGTACVEASFICTLHLHAA